MINRFSTDKFEIKKLGSDRFELKTTDMSNSIVINIRDINELVDVILKAEKEFGQKRYYSIFNTEVNRFDYKEDAAIKKALENWRQINMLERI